MKIPISKLVRRIKYMITASKHRIESPDPLIAYKAKVERDCATKILGFVLELVENKKTTT